MKCRIRRNWGLGLLAGLSGVLSGWAERVDVMVVYTPAVTGIHGGHEGVLAHVMSLVAGTNQAYADSGINQTLHLVHVHEGDYMETGSHSLDLDALTGTTDGELDEVHALRNACGADLVCLLNNGSGGIAWLLKEVAGQPNYGFSVVGTSGAGAGVFAHELGHNMGCHHDRAAAGSSMGLYAYSYGHRFTGSDGILYRTIMAYTPGARIMRFSNPLVTYSGMPTGIAAGGPEAADNAMTINVSSPVVSAYRAQVPAVPRFEMEPRDVKAITGTVVVIPTLVLGSPLPAVEWYAGLVGDRSSPVSTVSGHDLLLEVASGVRLFWARAVNSAGATASRQVRVEGIPAWTKGLVLDQEQALGNYRWAHSSGGRYWQEIVPSMPFLNSVEVFIYRTGSPDRFGFQLRDDQGFLLYETVVTGTPIGWRTIPVGIWVEPGRTYRMEFVPGPDTENYFAWAFSFEEDPYPAGVSWGVSRITDLNDYLFRTRGGSNRSPVLQPVGNRTLQVGESLQIVIHGTDADGDSLSYSASGGQ